MAIGVSLGIATRIEGVLVPRTFVIDDTRPAEPWMEEVLGFDWENYWTGQSGLPGPNLDRVEIGGLRAGPDG